MADDLIPVMLKIVDATEAVLTTQRQARAAGQIERSISLQLILRSQQDAMLAMAELLESEGTSNEPPPTDGVPRAGRRLRVVAG
jgi:hypothetical protein